jgi:hypothetical protein
MPAPSKDDFHPGHPRAALRTSPTNSAGTVSQLGILRDRQSSQPAQPAKPRAPDEITTSRHKLPTIRTSPISFLIALPRGKQGRHEGPWWVVNARRGSFSLRHYAQRLSRSPRPPPAIAASVMYPAITNKSFRRSWPELITTFGGHRNGRASQAAEKPLVGGVAATSRRHNSNPRNASMAG